MNFRFDIVYEYRHMFLHGVYVTLGFTLVSVMIGMVLGLIGALARLAHTESGGIIKKSLLWVVRQISLAYVTFFRGTPLFVQIFIWYYVWFTALVNPIDGWIISGEQANVVRREWGVIIAGILALSVNAGAYMTEIFRAGIQSIDKGQIEAARSLGLTYGQTMKQVVLPQAIRRMLPPFGNEFITLLKDSSLLSAIAVAELAYTARTISGRFLVYEEPYYTVALIYLLLTTTLAWGFSWLEKCNKIDSH